MASRFAALAAKVDVFIRVWGRPFSTQQCAEQDVRSNSGKETSFSSDPCLQMAGDEGKLAFFKYTVTIFQRDRVSSSATSFLGKRFANFVGVFRPATFVATCDTSSAF